MPEDEAPAQVELNVKGFETSKGVQVFRQFVAELNGEGLDANMRLHLSGGSYEAWLRQGKDLAG